MRRLRFRYYMKLSFSDSVSNHRFSLKCIPKSDMRQHITITRREIYPNSFISEDNDSFGNLIIYGFEERNHMYFFFDVEGEAEFAEEGTGLFFHDQQDNRCSLFKYQTVVTCPGDFICKYYEELSQSYEEEAKKLSEDYGSRITSDQVEFALYTMQRLGADYKYASGVTDIQTKAEDAMRLRSGVCQDYAHIMLSLCRMRRIPCRYVTGMMLGEGKSHAWVEVYSGDGWIGMDPTNSQLVDDSYIKIAHGRDYSDCLVNQGIFTGNVIQQQEINVNVEEIG